MASASSTRNAGTVSDPGSDWTQEAQADGAGDTASGTDDTRAALSSARSSGTSGAIQFTNFGFTIPSDATVDSIRATVFGRRIQEAVTAPDTKIFLRAGVAIGSTKVVTNQLSDIYEAASKAEGSGTVTGYWNVSGGLTPAEVNASNFGFNYFFGPVGGGGTEQQGIDYVEIEISYTTPDPETGTTPFERGRTRSRMRRS